MIHPGVTDLVDLTDAQLEAKLFKLNSMYFITENESVRQQMLLLIDTYKLALEERQLEKKKQEQDGKDDLDNLINVS